VAIILPISEFLLESQRGVFNAVSDAEVFSYYYGYGPGRMRIIIDTKSGFSGIMNLGVRGFSCSITWL
jgi:hypothetical protein